MTVSVTVTFASAEEAITALAKLRATDTKDAAAPAKPVKADKAADCPYPAFCTGSPGRCARDPRYRCSRQSRD